MFELVDLVLDGINGDVLPEMVILLRVAVIDLFFNFLAALMYLFSRMR